MDRAEWEKPKRQEITAEGEQQSSKLEPWRWTDKLAADLHKLERGALLAWGDWLASRRWQLYVILTFAYGVLLIEAKEEVDEYLERLKARYPRLTAFVSWDKGRGGRRVHAHLFISGLFPKRLPKNALRSLTIKRAIKVAKQSWTCGLVKHIGPYDPSKGAPDYLAQYQTHYADTGLGGEFWGRPIKKKKRRKRGPRKPKQQKEEP